MPDENQFGWGRVFHPTYIKYKKYTAKREISTAVGDRWTRVLVDYKGQEYVVIPRDEKNIPEGKEITDSGLVKAIIAEANKTFTPPCNLDTGLEWRK